VTAPQSFPGAALDRCGLNRQAVFDLDELPDDMPWKDGALAAGYRQLILIGHGGRSLWEAVTRSGIDSPDPIDDFTLQTIGRWMAEELPGHRYDIIYPGPQTIPLQRLGALAGWHHATPFMLGIDADWGTWFAYRAAVLADTHFAPVLAVDRTAHEASNPCAACATRPCVAACPASAMSDASFALQKCLAWRQLADSTCAFTCRTRLACPVGSEHRYGTEQLRHTYSVSLRQIREHA
jgi:epoxyqueuosine reductase